MTALASIADALGLSTPRGIMPRFMGHATEALLDAILRAVLIAAIVWQLIMATIALATFGIAGWPLVAANVLILAAARPAREHVSWRWGLAVAMYAAALWSYVASGDVDSPLTFAACWQINFASCFVGLILLRRAAAALVVGGAVGNAVGLVVFLPQWGPDLPISTVVTQLSIIVGLRLGLGTLLRFSTRVDEAVRSADDANIRTETLQYHSARLAEESRILHDTAVNTFAAIATAGAGVQDHEQVRQQCARDARLIAGLREQTHARSTNALHDIFLQPGLRIQRHGATDAELSVAGEKLSPDSVAAVVGCVREAVTNATKHSGADHVDISVSITPRHITIDVRDDGVGFAGEFPTDRGVGSSIVGRARAHGFDAEVRSAEGHGTTVTVVVPRTKEEADAGGFAPDTQLVQAGYEIDRRSSTYWGIGVTLVSVVLTMGGGANGGNALWPMIAVMFAAVVIARVRVRRLAWLQPLLLIASTIVVFLLSARATGFGAVGARHWQALAQTGPFILLLSLSVSTWWRRAAWIVWAATIVTVVALMVPISAAAAVIVAIAGVIGIGFAALWSRFQTLVDRLAVVAEEARRDEYAARLRNELEVASQEAFRRWLDAGLDDAVDLLTSIEDGRLDLDHESTRRQCDEEERYLRQFVHISPELVYVSQAAIPTLRRARELNVALTLRLGDVDAPSEEAADIVRRTIEGNLVAVGANQSLTVTLFPSATGLNLTLTGPQLDVPVELADRARHTRMRGIELLEVVL